MIYYHGTSKDNAENIIRQGIKKNNSKYSGGIYLTTNYSEAQKYSKIASNGKLGKVLMIHKNALDDSKIKHHDKSIIQYNDDIDARHIKEEISMNVSAVAGTGDSRLPPDQREPGIKKKKQLRDIIKRNAK